ncbi:MAG: YegP family protein, partial [Oscillospiraceae bacterium]|nr:YegP family protein [Oscillospiraceae bacterium]
MGKFVINKTNTGFTYSLKAGNGEIIAIGGEVYNTLASVKNGVESVKKNAPIANIEDQTEEGFKEEK